MKEIRLIAPFHNKSGYAKAGRAILSALLLKGYRVQAIEMERRTVIDVRTDGTQAPERYYPTYQKNLVAMPECQRRELMAALEIEVLPTAPTFIMGNANALTGCQEFSEEEEFRVGLSMWEVEYLPRYWDNGVKSPDMLALPSLWNIDSLPSQKEATFYPLGVDERVYNVDGEVYGLPLPSGRKKPHEFSFLSVFSVCERKNWRRLMQAFAEEFRGEDVALYIKCGKENEHEVDQLAFWCHEMGANVYVIHDDFTDEDMASLYRAANYYILPSTEGFGLPYIEAAMCGTPSIGLCDGGSAEVLETLEQITVNTFRVPSIGLLPQIYHSDNKWYVPDMQNLRDTMRLVVNDKEGVNPYDLSSLAVDNYGIESLADRTDHLLGQTKKRTAKREPDSGLYSIAAVITTFNNLESTMRCEETLRTKAGFTGTIVLADDGSTDGTIEWARDRGISVVECYGGNVSKNRQTATDYLQSEGACGYILYLDNDIESKDDWITPLIEVMSGNPYVGIIAPLKRFPNGSIQNLGNKFFPNGGTRPSKYIREFMEVDYVESAAMLVSPHIWEEVTWCEDFPIFYEDADYCLQARIHDYIVVASSLGEVTHHAHTTSSARSNEAETNRKKFLSKWGKMFL